MSQGAVLLSEYSLLDLVQEEPIIRATLTRHPNGDAEFEFTAYAALKIPGSAIKIVEARVTCCATNNFLGARERPWYFPMSLEDFQTKTQGWKEDWQASSRFIVIEERQKESGECTRQELDSCCLPVYSAMQLVKIILDNEGSPQPLGGPVEAHEYIKDHVLQYLTMARETNRRIVNIF